ncbi:Rieske 2Fe-2S domain-containing protein [Sphingosinicella soli]|uniref:Phthalate 4,5-dioxygenase oxygenase subunit n=1 Tax=Sphingosinicella soli TaxID=333708 RepID=A0A7W7B447_9SPHN|nr:Rieske 2Fe-2S domain-containing protein [Sphingosinicella soli]MBB4632748.1 phthalate 4,5-dioxygenase oxygenase subunit [Sphingosinicella soli]
MTPEQNDLMCRVEGGAPMGRVMRQVWLPACMSEEIAEPDSAPVRVRLLGENMVAFRDTSGRVGILDEQCPHRRASLYYGRNEGCGLRCLYHGWKFDVDGNAVDMSSEPAGAKLRESMRTRAYPVQESGGFVWVWMGDPAAPAPFMPPVWSAAPDERIAIVKMHAACNWAQVLEGAIDSAHSSSLHSTNMPTATDVSGSTATDSQWLRPSADKSPRLQVDRTPYGFRYAAIRTPIRDPGTQDYIRTTLYIAPFTVMIPPTDRYKLIQMLVPIDDENCMFYWIAWHETQGISAQAWRSFCGAVPGEDVDPVTFEKVRNARNNYLQDRAAMKAGDFTGIYGIPAQDMAMWESMGPLADRSEDRLGSSDKAIFEFRKLALSMASAAAEGRVPNLPGFTARDAPSFEQLVPKTVDWRDVGKPAA